jgi:hypothetical protein
MDLTAYRRLLRDSRARRLLAGLAVSSLGPRPTVTSSRLAPDRFGSGWGIIGL